jgi:hypothetical protein
MSSAKVNVTVRSRGKVVDGPFSRPVRLTPAGHAGVVYGGEVYPLQASNVIELEDEAYDKHLCERFVQPGAKIPYARAAAKAKTVARKPNIEVDAWSVEHNRFGNYLVFDADEDSAQATANLMVEIGLGVHRWDASWRPAADGKKYDWYIRLEFDGTQEENPPTHQGCPRHSDHTDARCPPNQGAGEEGGSRQRLSEDTAGLRRDGPHR